MIFKPYTAMASIRSPPLSPANNTSNPISPSNGCCVSGLCKSCPYFLQALMRRMLGLPYLFTAFMHANIGPQRRLPYPLQKHIKLDLVLERRVREAWSVQDAILITSIYASHVSACSPRARANPKLGTSRQFALQNTYQTRPRARTARA